MSQGKLKKKELPKGVQKKSKVLKRDDRTKPKKARPLSEQGKLKASLEKTIRGKIEEEMRAKASHGDGKPLKHGHKNAKK